MTREEFILEVWESMGREVVGASELGLIQTAFVERFGFAISPASIARVLAESGERLVHPEILQADASWRQEQLFFTAEDLDLANIEAATRLINTIEKRFEKDVAGQEHVRQAVRRLKNELASLPANNQLATEVAQWLTVWLQNPQIFAEWLTLRQNTPEFRERFLS
ncbi:MAG TPA: hypothetical protein VFI24_03615 [Pyrinomonadaceae bacterium]|nr:hypothetical protein [Pyrinomonadaceae bacterium]